ncbi:MAG: hypothetical protein EA397_17025 [Deltaproteobacteria bacterium]|nr:MAG: hypothetical protein EA397_17025 [Deltaproteobacteria bacterium]
MLLALRTPALTLAALALSTAAFAKDSGVRLEPEPFHPLVAHVVADSLQTYHYAKRPIDEDLSILWLDVYLDEWDGGRAYFLDSDVRAFKAKAGGIGADVLGDRPKLTLAFDVFDRYRLRAREVLKLAETELAEPLTFDDEEAFLRIVDDHTPWPKDRAEWKANWKDRMKAEVLDLVLGERDEVEARELVLKRYQRRAKAVEQFDSGDVVESYLSALSSVFDPHSAYYKPETSDDFDIRMRDALEGIGAELRMEDAYTQISRLIPGGPAEASGQLKKGDQIVAVAQDEGESVDVVDMRLSEVVKLIRGPKGSVVRLTIRPAGAADRSQTRVVAITRDRVQLERASAKGKLLEVPTTFQGQEVVRKVGLIEVPSFYFDSWAARQGEENPRSTTTDVAKAVEELRAQGAESMVLDFRGNGGGPLPEAVSLTGLFIDKGPVVQVHDPGRGGQVLRDKQPGVVWAGPLVVLTDELSASASEIVAGALQDYNRAVVVGGSQTHGKGTVQSVVDLGAVLPRGAFPEFADNAGALKFTVQTFYRITGESTQLKGVVPDIMLPSPWQGMPVLESDLDRPIPWDTIEPTRYTPLPATLDLDPIREASASRVASEVLFSWLEEDRKERLAREDRTSLSLHLPTRKAEREASEARYKARLKHLGISDPDEELDEDDEDERSTLGEAFEQALRMEAARIAVDVADRWTPPTALLNADKGKTAEVNPGSVDKRKSKGR